MELYIEPVRKSNKRDSLGRFMPGNKSWNKGLRMKGLKFNDTMFKDGHKPHNLQEDFHVSLRKDTDNITYKYIKVPGSGYVPMHRWVWEMERGEIPRGYIVRFKDGDTMNCSIENLEVLTRSENMQRNLNRQKASESIKELWRRERIRKVLELKPLTKLFNNHGNFKKRHPAPAMG